MVRDSVQIAFGRVAELKIGHVDDRECREEYTVAGSGSRGPNKGKETLSGSAVRRSGRGGKGRYKLQDRRQGPARKSDPDARPKGEPYAAGRRILPSASSPF